MFGWLKRKQRSAGVPQAYTPGQLMPLSGLAPVYRAEVERLEAHLANLLAETEALARLKLVEWKIRKAEERRAWLEHGVTYPKSDFERQQDNFFHAFESRLREEAAEAQERVMEIEHREARALQDQKWDEERRREKAQVEQRGQQLEIQRIEAQRAIAITISRALREDLSG